MSTIKIQHKCMFRINNYEWSFLLWTAEMGVQFLLLLRMVFRNTTSLPVGLGFGSRFRLGLS